MGDTRNCSSDDYNYILNILDEVNSFLIDKCSNIIMIGCKEMERIVHCSQNTVFAFCTKERD